MNNHKKKMIAPVIITILIIAYYSFFGVFCIFFDAPLIVKLLAVIITLTLSCICIYVLVERIREIRSGEEDDLSKY